MFTSEPQASFDVAVCSGHVCAGARGEAEGAGPLFVLGIFFVRYIRSLDQFLPLISKFRPAFTPLSRGEHTVSQHERVVAASPQSTPDRPWGSPARAPRSYKLHGSRSKIPPIGA